MEHGVRSALVMCVLLSACAIEPEDDDLGEVGSEVQTTNRLASNKLAANHLATAKLAGGALPDTVQSLISTADGREVLTYIVGCALAGGETLKVGGYAFPGSIGLAPSWRSRALTTSERRWVSACVYARTNLYGVQIALSLRGDHPALAAPLGEQVGYALVEGAFYGDLFDAHPTAYACLGLIKETGLPLSTLGARACAAPTGAGTTTGCGFTYTGACSVLDLGLAPACARIAAPYGDCRTGRSPKDPRIHEVITVVLATAL